MLKEILIKETVKLIFAFASKKIEKTSFKLESTNKNIEDALNFHIRSVKNWSNEITFKDLKSSKQTSKIFIPLDLFVYPKRIRMDLDERIKVIPLLEIFKKEKNHLAILGQPGAGKTTSMKFFCQSIFFDEKFYPEQFNFPILIKLRDFNRPIKNANSAGILFEYLFNLLGLKLNESIDNSKASKEQIIRIKETLVLELIENLKVLLIIDGFDELVFKSHREKILDEITQFSLYLENSKLIITSRTADYNSVLEKISVYEICPLNDRQILSFAEKWLGKEKSLIFIAEISNSPYNDTSIRPLTIAHLCAIYERSGKIPEKPKTVYRKIINLLLEEWDEQRGVKRNSKYALFEIDRKFEFLSSLAFLLTTRNGKAVFSKQDLTNVYSDIYVDFDLQKDQTKEVVNDIESHTGLFVQAGYDSFEFAHKSLQEYLCAEYIVKLPNIPRDKRLIERFPNELAISVTISSNPSLYFVELVDSVFSNLNLEFDFIQKFINRLILEKPDFNQNSNVGISALRLYSSYINKSNNIGIQLKLFNSDSLVYEFENLIDIIFKRNSKEVINSLFIEEYSFDTMDQTKVLIMKKRNKPIISELNHGIIKSIKISEIPNLLHCRESFLKKDSF